MTDEQNFFSQLVKSNFRIYDNIWKIATSQWDIYMTSYPLEYNCFDKYNKLIAVDLRKQQALNADPKAI